MLFVYRYLVNLLLWFVEYIGWFDTNWAKCDERDYVIGRITRSKPIEMSLSAVMALMVHCFAARQMSYAQIRASYTHK